MLLSTPLDLRRGWGAALERETCRKGNPVPRAAR